jgi:hypothetical protein
MSLLDRVLVAAGRADAAVSRRGRSPNRGRIVILALLLMSALPTLAISLISIPSEKTFEDIRTNNYRGLGWLRLEGDLHDAGVDDGRYQYTLHDPADESVAITIYAPGPLPTGATQVTGQVRTDRKLPGTFDTFYADAVTEPARHDPWLLIATPALIALFLIVGGRVGYPVVRRQRRRDATRTSPPLGPGEPMGARWSGWLQGEERSLEDPKACTVAVSGEADVRTVTVVDVRGSRTLVTRRNSPRPLGRVCRIGGCTPHLEIHAPGADVVLEFASAGDRDRLAASLA